MAEPRRMNPVSLLTSAALLLALASVVLTRGFRMFAVAEVLAIASFAAGFAMYFVHRRTSAGSALGGPGRLILGGAVVAAIGLGLKGIFVASGIGAPRRDMSTHEVLAGNPLLEHVHHLLFNVGFLLFALAAVGLLVRRVRA